MNFDASVLKKMIKNNLTFVLSISKNLASKIKNTSNLMNNFGNKTDRKQRLFRKTDLYQKHCRERRGLACFLIKARRCAWLGALGSRHGVALKGAL